MTLPKEEADALRRCLSILAPMHPAHERRTMALGIEKRISGQETALLGLRYVQIAALFYPSNAEKAHEFAQQLQAAADSGELATAIYPEHKGALISDLAAWPDCPPIPEESPLRYWLPYMPTIDAAQATQAAPPRILKKSAMVTTPVETETPKERRARWLAMFEAEKKREKNGALQRLANSEGVDRSNMSKDIGKARKQRAEQQQDGKPWVSQLVLSGKRAN